MKYYLIRFIDKHGIELFWRCQADDYDHAVEQLLDAEPGAQFWELLKEQGEQT